MKKLFGLALALVPMSVALAGAPDKEHPPQKATDEATPEMKNPGGTEKLHPPQKAMDEATESAPGKTDSSTGASSGTAGSSSTSGSTATEPKPGSKY